MLKENGSELRWILLVIRRWLWLIVGCIVLAAIAAWWYTSSIPPRYKATATLLVEPAQGAQANEYTTLVAGERLALTYGQMLQGQHLLETVITDLGLQDTSEELAERVSVEPVRDTRLIRLSVTDPSAEQAALLANTIARAFIDHIRALQEERYSSSLDALQVKLQVLNTQMADTQAQADALTAKRIEQEVEIPRLQSLLDKHRDDNRALQADRQLLESNITRVMDNVTIVEVVQAPRDDLVEPIVLGLRTSTALAAGQKSLILPFPRPYFTATATLLVDQPVIAGGGDYSAILARERLAATYGQILTDRPVLESVIARLGLKESADAVVQRVKIESVPGTTLIRLHVRDETSAEATDLATAIAEAFISKMQGLMTKPYADRLVSLQAEIDTLETEIAQTQEAIATFTAERIQTETDRAWLANSLSEYRTDQRALEQNIEQLRMAAVQAADTVMITEPAPVPEMPVHTRYWYALLAALIGALLGTGLAFLFDYLDETIRTPRDVASLLGISTLGAIDRLPRKEEPLVIVRKPLSPPAECFRILATNLRFFSVDKPLRIILITSPHPLEGKSFVAANVSVALAQAGLRVALVDADLRRPRQHEIFGLGQNPGLTDFLLYGTSEKSLQPTAQAGLSVLTSGEIPYDPAQLAGSERMRQLLEELAETCDMVVVDSPPVLLAADASSLATAVDGVLLVMRAGQTRGQAAEEAIESLRQVGANMVGAVINMVPKRKGSYYDYRYRQSDHRRAHLASARS